MVIRLLSFYIIESPLGAIQLEGRAILKWKLFSDGRIITSAVTQAHLIELAP